VRSIRPADQMAGTFDTIATSRNKTGEESSAPVIYLDDMKSEVAATAPLEAEVEKLQAPEVGET